MPLRFARGIATRKEARAYNPSFKHKTNYHPYYANTGLYLNIYTSETFRSNEDRIHDKADLDILDFLLQGTIYL